MPKHYDTPDTKLHKKWLRNPDIRLSNKNRIKGTSSVRSVDSIARALTLGKQIRRKKMMQKKRKQIKKTSQNYTRFAAAKARDQKGIRDHKKKKLQKAERAGMKTRMYKKKGETFKKRLQKEYIRGGENIPGKYDR